MNENKQKLLLLLVLINGLIGTILLMRIFYIDVGYSNSIKYDRDLLLKQEFMKNKFDYLHGIWLMPIGLFTVFLIIYLQNKDL